MADADENLIAEPGAGAVTQDALLGGALRLKQPARGYRFNIDTVLLAMAVGADLRPGPRSMLEVGCGVGAALIVAASRLAEQRSDVRFIGVDRDAVAAELARENVRANGFGDCISIIHDDAFEASKSLGAFDEVFFNPPYDAPGSGRAPAPERRGAHVADSPIERWIAHFSNHLVGAGAMTLIHRAERLGEILAALDGRLGGVGIIPIHPRAGEPAKRVVVRARKGSRAPLRLYESVNLHDESGAKYTPRIEALLRGEAPFVWS